MNIHMAISGILVEGGATQQKGHKGELQCAFMEQYSRRMALSRASDYFHHLNLIHCQAATLLAWVFDTKHHAKGEPREAGMMDLTECTVVVLICPLASLS